ncbi:response regulator [Allostreptomyces psammosilenae]|uniref:CheY-like chemotaxis protein n=1 Tax=Allostreptomyces psammosilenae TaxID=1892865 RepID=A0A853A786_9ACTN|nr:response regulator [Allostreptomyces psammosilenae]NYI06408.1 CheY-like chemotaxis protein [Allostreptomyces psammosilenae]
MCGATGRVLVVDDSADIRQLIGVNLELEGFEVVTAVDGVEALEAVHRWCPDVVTLDLRMPRLDGLHTVAALRADPRTQHLPIVVVSASGPRELARARQLGVAAAVAKPFDPGQLVAVVRAAAARGGAEANPVAGEPVSSPTLER